MADQSLRQVCCPCPGFFHPLFESRTRLRLGGKEITTTKCDCWKCGWRFANRADTRSHIEAQIDSHGSINCVSATSNSAQKGQNQDNLRIDVLFPEYIRPAVNIRLVNHF